MFSGDKKVILASALVAVMTVSGVSQAKTHAGHHRASVHARAEGHKRPARYARLVGAHVIQCVAFAKQDAGIDISGNARDWWNNAAGVYERGARPESGSVLSFQANGRMPLGHVAVVSGVQDSRTIVIEQAHWNSRGISRDIEVKDVSEDNDWSAVRVEMGHGGGFGSIYPTHGFIYPRPDRGTMEPNLIRTALPRLDAASADLRGRHARRAAETEIAELPVSGHPLDLTVSGLSFDAPNRALR